MDYNEDEYLQIAGIQHFSFCRRQWALIHLEQQWSENVKTIEGQIVHEKAHNHECIEKRGNTLITRGLEATSKELGIYGVCDVVEFHKCKEGVKLIHYDGNWIPMVVEYKRGKPKTNDADRLQVLAQTMCLEEMFCCHIDKGAIFYHEVNHREVIEFTDTLRCQLRTMVKEMHVYYKNKRTPKVSAGKFCNACSLKDICIPQLNKDQNVHNYIKRFIEDKI